MKLLICIVMSTLLFSVMGCSNYLDAKSDGSLAIPNTLADLQALLDYEDRMILGYPEAGDIAADYYFLNDGDWQARSVDTRSTYLWDKDAQNNLDWTLSYQRIFICNTVLDQVDNAKLGSLKEVDRNLIKGSAYFFRGFSYLHLVQLFCPYHAVDMEDSKYGLPLQLMSDINEKVSRSSVKQTYGQIEDDLKQAAALLADKGPIATRPSKLAAHLALARLYLIIGDYEKALDQSTKALAIERDLQDYNVLDSTANFPFKLLNKEVLFNAVISASSGAHTQSTAYVDTQLMKLYNPDDLRLSMFFRRENNGLYRFKGSYDASSVSIFGGLVLDELFLIAAECLARLDNEDEARSRLNELLVKRWRKGKFIPVGNELSGDGLLRRILEEREKELCFRGGIRWSDLRRLNRDPRFAKTLTRTIQGIVYKLEPNDHRYTFLIPNLVISISGIEQNLR